MQANQETSPFSGIQGRVELGYQELCKGFRHLMRQH